MLASECTSSVGDIWLKSCLLATKVNLSRWITVFLCIQAILPLAAVPLKRTSKSKHSSATNLFRKHPRSQDVVITPGYYDWCDAKAHEPSLVMTGLAQAQSLEQPEEYDWDVTRNGLLQLVELAKEVSSLSDKVLSKVDDLFNSDPDNTRVFAVQYLDYANTTPEAKRETRENAIEVVIEASEMARKIDHVLRRHAHTMSRMLARFELLHNTESHEELKGMLWGYTGDTRIFLCKMQQVFREVAPQDNLPGPTNPESDMNIFEAGTLGEKKNHMMRWYGTYGVSIRQQEILGAIQSDFVLLTEQINVHYGNQR